MKQEDFLQTSIDDFLGGQLKIEQPLTGFRASTDAVFLGASVLAKPGDHILELGCGVGTACLCLGTRIKALSLVGVELQKKYADLAEKNAKRNHISFEIIHSSITALPSKITEDSYDHVIMNPPYFSPRSKTKPHSKDKEMSHFDQVSIENWLNIACKRIKPKGYLVLIQHISNLQPILAHLPQSMGSIQIIPLASYIGNPAKRFILYARKNRKADLIMHAPIIIHSNHGKEKYNPQIEKILRDGYGIHSLISNK